MTDMHRAAHLIEKYLADVATDRERAELEQALQASRDVADAFARSARTDARLDEYFTEHRESQRVERLLRETPRQPTRFRLPRGPIRWAAAAMLAVAAGIGVFFSSTHSEGVPYAVVSGRVLVEGIESQNIRAGARVEVVGDEAAVIRLAADGSVAELSPSSKGVLRGRMFHGGQVVELTRGSCEFHLENGEGQVRVETPVGEVLSQGAEFAVELRPAPEAKQRKRQLALALIVAVMAGTVDVQFNNDSYTLGLGDNRVYGGGKPASAKPNLTGTVIAVAEDGQSFTLETPPPAKREPTGKRVIRFTAQTELSYVNVPWQGEKPTVGYLARVWLAEGSAESAEAVTFGAQKPSGPKPAFAGSVTAVAPGGKEFTLQLPPVKKGGVAPTVTVKITDQTKLSYALVPMDGEKPTVGYNASVWLVEGSKDTAAAVTFSGKKASAPQPSLYGKVTAVSDDGKELTLELAGKKKGTAGPTATVKISAKTKLVYAGFDKNQPKPTVGIEAAVWLEKGSPDEAASIRFGPLAGKKGAPAPAVGGKVPGLFALPKGIEWTPEQQPRVAALLKELQPTYQAWFKKKDSVLTAEQKAALQIAGQAVKEAGLTDKRQIRQALDAAVAISPEQKAELETLAKEENALRQAFLDKLQTLMTPEQKAKFSQAAPSGKPVPKPKR